MAAKLLIPFPQTVSRAGAAQIDRLGLGGSEFFLDNVVLVDGLSGLEVFEFEDLPDFDIDVLIGAVDIRDATGPSDSFLEGIGFDDPITANEFPGFGERAVGDGTFSAGNVDAGTLELG